jgi:predicted DNA-binding transcriptional regulator YafY
MNKSTDLQQVKVFFTHNVAKLIADQRYYYGFVSEKKSDKGIEMTFMVGHLEYFARWLLMFTSSVTVLEPADLQDRVQALVQELSTHHSADIGLSY